jgi:putative MATE family efflux protein
VRGSPFDRQILRLALPALGALAAEPAYLLADTAIVGHLGTRELAALALAATVLSTLVSLCNFLAYGTTAQVARLHGAGEQARAGALAAQALWLALAIGAAVALLCVVAADPIMSLLGGGSQAADPAARYLRLSAPGIPCALIALAGQGYLRGIDRLRIPLVILVAANVVNIVLEVVLVYGLDLGLDGSALGTVAAQLGMGTAFAVLLLRATTQAGATVRPHAAPLRALMRIGGDLLVRTGSLLAAFTLAGAVLARESEAALAAHQVAMQLFVFLALVLDAVAIAGQILVGRLLGAGDAGGAYAAARRMIGWSLLLGLVFAATLALCRDVIPRGFSGDGDVLHEAHTLWPLFVLMQPVGAIVFALDGILIGASDTRYIAGAMAFAFAVFAPVVLIAGALDWGVAGVWAALNVLMLARLGTMAARFAGRRWAVIGAPG